MPPTDTAVRNAGPRDKDYAVADTDGLALFVTTTGSKTWHFRFSWAGKQPRISLGAYPELSLKDARAQRDEARAMVERGVDPRVQRVISGQPLDHRRSQTPHSQAPKVIGQLCGQTHSH